MRPCTALDWNDFRHFLAVARAGTFAGAARSLGVEHTTVGRRINALESALRVRLFVRAPDGLTLTDAGRAILPSVEAIAGHFEAIERRVAGGDERVAGTVRLTIPESGNAYFVQNLCTLRERHPELVIEVLTDNRALDIRRGEADLAVRFREVTDPELIVRKAGKAGWSIYASADYLGRKGPLASPEAIEGHEVIGFDTSLSDIEGARWLREHGKGASIVLRGNTLAAIANAAAVGFGLALLPCFVAQHVPGLVRMTPHVVDTRDILLVVHPDLARAARVRVTLDFLVELLTRDAALWRGTP